MRLALRHSGRQLQHSASSVMSYSSSLLVHAERPCFLPAVQRQSHGLSPVTGELLSRGQLDTLHPMRWQQIDSADPMYLYVTQPAALHQATRAPMEGHPQMLGSISDPGTQRSARRSRSAVQPVPSYVRSAWHESCGLSRCLNYRTRTVRVYRGSRLLGLYGF